MSAAACSLREFRSAVRGKTWLVTGQRPIPGGFQKVVASSWGATETEARVFYQRLQALEQRQRPWDTEPIWQDEELTFVEVKEVES